MAWIVCYYKHDSKFSNYFSDLFSSEFNIFNDVMTYVAVGKTNRFPNDQLLIHNPEVICIIEGILLNKIELFTHYHASTMQELYERLMINDRFWSLFRGPFSGIQIDNTSKKMVIFGNQTGDTSVFYLNNQHMAAASSDFNLLLELCKAEKQKLSFNSIYANHMLSLGFVTEGNTIFKEISRTQPGMYVEIDENQIGEYEYQHFTNKTRLNISFDEAIDLVDSSFRSAVKRCFDKDLEYGYSHLADMSGGLDSRMTNWVAHELGYLDITNICYAKKDSNEEKYALTVSMALNNEFIFRPQDDLKFIFDLENTVKSNYGLSIYSGITSGKRLLSSLNFNKYGLEQTGQLGDVAISSFCSSQSEDRMPVTLDSRIVYTDINEPILTSKNRYESFEEFALYIRGFNGALTTHYIRREFTEAVSPFMDVDFLQTCLSIPLEYRCGHKLYWAWIKKKYPKAAELRSTTPDLSKKKITWREVASKIVGKHKRKVYSILIKLGMSSVASSSNNMNPMDYWYNNNRSIQTFFNDYFRENIELFNFDLKIKESIIKVFNGVRCADKCLALTLLAAYKVYCHCYDK